MGAYFTIRHHSRAMRKTSIIATEALECVCRPKVSIKISKRQLKHYIQTLDDGAKVPTLPFRLGSIKQYKPSCDAPRLGENSHEVREWLADKLAGKALK